MGVITTRHLDDSELTQEELLHWGPRVQQSLHSDYLERLRALRRSNQYDNEEALEAAWTETIATNEVCKAVSAISAQRRVERMLASGGIAEFTLNRYVTEEEVEAVLRNVHPEGDLQFFDGTVLKDGELAAMTELINDPDRLKDLLESQQGSHETSLATSSILERLRTRWRAALAPRATEPALLPTAARNTNHLAGRA